VWTRTRTFRRSARLRSSPLSPPAGPSIPKVNSVETLDPTIPKVNLRGSRVAGTVTRGGGDGTSPELQTLNTCRSERNAREAEQSRVEGEMVVCWGVLGAGEGEEAADVRDAGSEDIDAQVLL